MAAVSDLTPTPRLWVTDLWFALISLIKSNHWPLRNACFWCWTLEAVRSEGVVSVYFFLASPSTSVPLVLHFSIPTLCVKFCNLATQNVNECNKSSFCFFIFFIWCSLLFDHLMTLCVIPDHQWAGIPGALFEGGAAWGSRSEEAAAVRVGPTMWGRASTCCPGTGGDVRSCQGRYGACPQGSGENPHCRERTCSGEGGWASEKGWDGASYWFLLGSLVSSLSKTIVVVDWLL